MKIDGSVALVTGANRGLGRHFAEQLRDRGATVYAATRDPAAVEYAGVTPITLDVTDLASVQRAAALTGDVTLLINNAGSSTGASLLSGSLDSVRLEMETHYFDTLNVIRAFAPQLALAQESVILNVLSVLSWLSLPTLGAYCAAKSAEWSLTNALRQALAHQGTKVSALHMGYVDTDMTRGLDVPKHQPADVVQFALDGVEAGLSEILADELSHRVVAGLSGGVGALYPGFA